MILQNAIFFVKKNLLVRGWQSTTTSIDVSGMPLKGNHLSNGRKYFGQ